MLITLTLIGMLVLLVPSVMEYFQPRDALVVFKSPDTEETLWNKLLSMWTISVPVVQIPEIWNSPQHTYPIMYTKSTVETKDNFFGFVLAILCVVIMITYGYFSMERRNKSPYAGKIVISELKINTN